MPQLESQSRSIVKALSYRLVGASLTTTIALLLTHRVGLAAAFGLLDVIVKILGYYLHERLWDRIEFGRIELAEIKNSGSVLVREEI